MAMEAVLRRAGIDATTHGFRSSFRDWAGDHTSFPGDVVEIALAHVIENKTKAAYRRRDVLEKRRKLMAAWDKYCNAPNDGATPSLFARGTKRAQQQSRRAQRHWVPRLANARRKQDRASGCVKPKPAARRGSD
jgi:hypothetical protein